MPLAGLQVLRGFLSAAECRTAFDAATLLSLRASELARASPAPYVTSSAHNVNSEEYYKSIALPVEEGIANCEHFDDCDLA